MTRNSDSYLATFPNTQEGLATYRTFIWGFRKGTKCGRFVKMFRGGTRNYRRFTNYKGKLVTMGGSCSLKDGTHFDVYHYNRYKYVDNRRARV